MKAAFDRNRSHSLGHGPGNVLQILLAYFRLIFPASESPGHIPCIVDHCYFTIHIVCLKAGCLIILKLQLATGISVQAADPEVQSNLLSLTVLLNL